MTMESRERTATYVVDRREGSILVLVHDETGSAIEVQARELPRDFRREGAVVVVQLAADGSPDWSTAKRDRAEEKRQFEELGKRVERLKRRDPGGDVTL